MFLRHLLNILGKQFGKIRKRSVFIFFVSLMQLISIQNTILSYELNKKEINITKPNEEYIDNLPKNEYILGTGDIFRVVISKSVPNLTTNYKVDGVGTVFLNRLGQKFVKGLTIDELKSILQKEYLQYVYEPEIEIQMLSYRPLKIYIEGEVAMPGMYTLPGYKGLDQDFTKLNANQQNNSLSDEDIFDQINLNDFQLPLTTSEFGFQTLFDALRQAGGVSNYSDLSNIEIIRKDTLSNGGGKKKASINFLGFFENADNTKNIRLYDEDVIKVKKTNIEISGQLNKAIKTNLNPKFIKIFIAGRVENRGTYNVTKGTSLNDAFEIAGGLKVIKGPIQFIRYRSDGSIIKRKFRYASKAPIGSYKNPYLESGDIIYIGKGKFNIASEVISEVTSPFAGLVNAYGVLKVFTD